MGGQGLQVIIFRYIVREGGYNPDLSLVAGFLSGPIPAALWDTLSVNSKGAPAHG